MLPGRICNALILAACLFLSLLISSCMPPPMQVQYYRLSGRAIPAVNQTQAPATILVGPVRVDSFLGQGPLVKQNSQHSVILLEQHHWAGNLDEMLSRLIIRNLSLDLKHKKIYSYPETSGAEGIRLEISFFHFEKDFTNNAFLEARWKIIQNSDHAILFSSTSSYTTTPETPGYDALVSGLSMTLEQLCQEIANAVENLNSNQQRQP